MTQEPELDVLAIFSHPDDAATSRIVREAARLTTMRRYDEESGLQAIKMPGIAHAVYSRLVLPSFIVDVSEFAQKKMEAIGAHASQFYSPESRSPTPQIGEKVFLRQIEDRRRFSVPLRGGKAGKLFY